MESINPATGERVARYDADSEAKISETIGKGRAAFADWKECSFAERAKPMRTLAELLRSRKAELARLITREMGKLLKESEAEIEKCADCCVYYAEHAEALLADAPMRSVGHRSFVTYQPLGLLLAVMPWNFPFWQVFRFAAPHLMAGNAGLLKHASNVSGCALMIEALFREAGFPENLFGVVLTSGKEVAKIIADPRINAITLTGSTEAGRSVAATAGQHLKKTVLELGGSDPYVILADADLEQAAKECASSRLLNAGQSCIAAKRFILLEPVKEAFSRLFAQEFANRILGDPEAEKTTLAPMARADLADSLRSQVRDSVAQGAKLYFQGESAKAGGAFHPPIILDAVTPDMTAFKEELFGPVAALVTAKDEDEAFALANASPFGLGSAIFTSDVERGLKLARNKIEAGQCFINGLVRSDPALPFGGVKQSGYGRELGGIGIREFANAKTVWSA